jgi:hypothetical protein
VTRGRLSARRLLIAVVVAAVSSLAATLPGLEIRPLNGGTGEPDGARTVTAPKRGAYLGAFVNTAGTKKGGTFQVVLANLPAFTAQMGRNPAIVPAYQPWTKPWVRNDNLTVVADSYGAIPMVAWHCGVPNEEIASGAEDALVEEFALQLKDYGRPVFLRWYWEPNIWVYPACLGPGSVAEQAEHYVEAYRRIARIFQRVGASNVAFVWSASTLTDAARMQLFYPGDKYVDWIGADGYDRDQHGRASFTEQFTAWYERFAPRRKPMIITETGATTDQSDFLAGVADALPRHFREIKGFLYFDSVGATDWRLSSYGGAGIEAFRELGRMRYFAPRPEP